MMGGGIFGLLIVGLLIYFFFNNSTQDRMGRNHNEDPDDALEILKIRYANGEISEEEYHRKKAILKESE